MLQMVSYKYYEIVTLRSRLDELSPIFQAVAERYRIIIDVQKQMKNEKLQCPEFMIIGSAARFCDANVQSGL